ncbi:hypothetical protein HYPSUDRAFT_597398 [Hypholoma sublateritium FD-334 SS-4]|uniref:Uncharacterized protein n=1 Tax=Hypholoma sublateritium (strain FD-334 SS-4) TaxID=945553 RepID=A0A0D2MI21_HYPSF|nr:hypothetical protein HYPSUDRAFT_597398 [Hypholoma sublateritium FD-334 SS-4]
MKWAFAITLIRAHCFFPARTDFSFLSLRKARKIERPTVWAGMRGASRHSAGGSKCRVSDISSMWGRGTLRVLRAPLSI